MSNPTLFDPAANAAVKALYESSIGGNNGNGSNRDNDYSGGGGTSSAAMGSGTAKRGFNFGL